MMLTGKKLVDTLTAELGEIGMGNMASELDAMYRSPEFLELDLLSAIARLVETEYQAQTNKQTNKQTYYQPTSCRTSAGLSAGHYKLCGFFRTGIFTGWNYRNAFNSRFSGERLECLCPRPI